MPALRAGGLDTGGERSFDGEDPDVSGEQQLHPLVAGQADPTGSMEGVQDTPDQDIKLPESEAALIPKTKLVYLQSARRPKLLVPTRVGPDGLTVETVRKLLHLESAVLKLPGLPSEYDIILTAGRIFVYGTPIEDIQGGTFEDPHVFDGPDAEKLKTIVDNYYASLLLMALALTINAALTVAFLNLKPNAGFKFVWSSFGSIESLGKFYVWAIKGIKAYWTDPTRKEWTELQNPERQGRKKKSSPK